jgi:type I restriction enzyme R subunit
MIGGSSNFLFLQRSEPQLYRLGLLAERYFVEDPNTCQIKLRQLSELTTQLTASRFGLVIEPSDNFADVLRRLKFECSLPREVGELFHSLRVAGNHAAHGSADDHASALTGLKLARQLTIWYLRTFYNPADKFGPFVPPAKPADANLELLSELGRLKAELAATQSEAELLKSEAVVAKAEQQSAAELAAADRRERVVWESLAEEAESGRSALTEQLREALAFSQSDNAPAPEIVAVLARDAADQINLDEADTRTLIDQQLREAGWEADTPILRYANGSRPVKGRNRAIAEWPTMTGPADYALFCGTTLVGTIEAKRRNRNVMAVLRQAERYASDINMQEAVYAEDGPWSEFKAPFAFSTNGRPYLKQVEALSGIWRRDLRDQNNPSEVLAGCATFLLIVHFSAPLRRTELARRPRLWPFGSLKQNRFSLRRRL